MNKAIFLDRDDTLIKDTGYLCDPEKIALLPGVIDGLRMAKEAGYRLFLFSNQSGVGRGFFTLEQANACTLRMLDLVGLGEDLFQDICLATEVPSEMPIYRKPSPRFILESIKKYTLDPSQCWMIGDRISDVQAGINAGIRTIFLSYNHSLTESDKAFLKKHNIFMAKTLQVAITQILDINRTLEGC